MEKFELEYENIEKIGEGSYGIVYRSRCKTSGQMFAVKKVKLYDNDEGIPSTTLREIGILKEMRHKNIVELKNVVINEDPFRIFLIFEYLDYDLGKFLYSKQALSSYQQK